MASQSHSQDSAEAQRARRLLIVDDNRDGADTLSMLLSFLGYATETAYDGREAIDKAASFRPDMVILDINMPVMDGYQAAKVLRHSNDRTRLVLVALTAAGSESDKEAAREAGFDFHVLKPVDGAALAGFVERALQDQPAPPSNRGSRSVPLQGR
jgi:CheY-like chemotaxis protein